MNVLRKSFFPLLIALLLFSLTACGQNKDQMAAASDEVPKEVSAFITEYWEAVKEDGSSIVRYRHWEDEKRKELALENPVFILDYEIAEIEKLSDQLYVFKVRILDYGMPESRLEAEEYSELYNYAARIDDEWYICANEQDIPADIKEGLDLSSYKTGTVVGYIDGIEVIEID